MQQESTVTNSAGTHLSAPARANAGHSSLAPAAGAGTGSLPAPADLPEHAGLTDEQILDLACAGSPDGPVAPPNPASPQEAASAIDDANSAPASAGWPQSPQESAAAPEPLWLRQIESQLGPEAGPAAAAEARSWRQAALNAAALDRDYFSASPQDRAGLAARLHQTDPAAFRAMLADAARVLAERDPQALAEIAQQLAAPPQPAIPGRPEAPGEIPASANAGAFPAEAYRQFAAATNAEIERQVRDSIERTLSQTLPPGIADGARRRISDDIFRELSAALSADPQLGAQIGSALSGPLSANRHRFDAAASRQIVSLLAARARVALPEVARRVITEWTCSVLASDRARQARIDAAMARRDITGGRLPEPVAASALLPRRLDYSRLSDEQILEM